MSEYLVNDNGEKMEVLDHYNVSNLNNADANFSQFILPNVKLTDAQKFNAIQNPSKQVTESIGDTFVLVGIIAHTVQVINEDDSLASVPRLILLGSKGENYVSVSKTMFSCIQNLLAVFNTNEKWGEGLKVKIKQTSGTGNKRYFSLELL